jgi:clumping factor B
MSFFKKFLTMSFTLFSSFGILFGVSDRLPQSMSIFRRERIQDDGQLYLEHAKAINASSEWDNLAHRSHSSHRSHQSHRSHYSSSSSKSSKSYSSSSKSYYNSTPVAFGSKITLKEDSKYKFKLKATDKNKKDKLIYKVLKEPLHGKVNLQGKRATYIPNKDYFGKDRFLFIANDGKENSNLSEVLITVTPVNDPPVSQMEEIVVLQNTSKEIFLYATDIDNADLKYQILKNPKYGSILQDGSIITYSTKKDFIGADGFSFKTNDGKKDSKSATVKIQVRSDNSIPEAISDSVTFQKDTPLEIELKAKDKDGDRLTYIIIKPPGNGILKGVIGTSKFLYTPNSGFIGNDKFEFKVNDGFVDSDCAVIKIAIDKSPKKHNKDKAATKN